MKPHLAAIVALTVPTMAAAACPDGTEPLLNCTFQNGAKTVSTCLDGDQATYSFGPTGGMAELQMVQSVLAVDMDPWHGFGRWITEGFTFENGDYAYELRYGIDRLSEDGGLEADLRVSHKDQTLALLTCDAGSIETGYPLPLFDAKVVNGQTWDREEMTWTISDKK